MECNEIFSIYKKLQYIKKLLLVQKFDKMLCAVKSMCKNNSTGLLFGNITGFETEVAVDIHANKAKIEYVKCYGNPPNDCFDEVLLAEIVERLANENKTN